MGSGGGCNFSVCSSDLGRGSEHLLSADFPPGLTQHPALLIGSIALLVVVGFGLFALFLYINSVMRFILFDSAIKRKNNAIPPSTSGSTCSLGLPSHPKVQA